MRFKEILTIQQKTEVDALVNHQRKLFGSLFNNNCKCWPIMNFGPLLNNWSHKGAQLWSF